MPRVEPPIIVVGAGINGAAAARELAVCGLTVWVVDSRDICFGTTAYSSRLIHGGLRYLEYGDVRLVRESLAERGRLLRLAPQFVRPLELLVPIATRLGGWRQGLLRLAGREPRQTRPRGLWAVRAGLFAYDLLARGGGLPRHRLLAKQELAKLAIHPRYAWVCRFYDAQVPFPERLVLALLADAQQAAREQGNDFRVYTYSRVRRRGPLLCIEPQIGSREGVEIEPLAVVNATGPWVDETLLQLDVPAQRLIAGTKGSHILTDHPALRAALGERGLYAEAADGRPVFILPFGKWVLIGTTDLPYEGDPAEARATQAELDYLIESVNHVLPDVRLTAADIDMHYCGVRPLRASGRFTPAARSRRHSIEVHCGVPWPLVSLVGGKLTTCRELAAETANCLLAGLQRPRVAHTTDRPLPGAQGFPTTDAALSDAWESLARLYNLRLQQVRSLWQLYGTRAESVLAAALTSGPAERPVPMPPTAAGDQASGQAACAAATPEATERPAQAPGDGPASHAAQSAAACIAGTHWPVAVVRWIIEHEWACTVSDLVERRLMLLYDRGLTQATLAHLAALLVQAGRVPSDEAARQVDAARTRLADHFGKRLAP